MKWLREFMRFLVYAVIGWSGWRDWKSTPMSDRECLIHQAADVLFPVVHPDAARVLAEDPGGTCSWDQSYLVYAAAIVDAGWTPPSSGDVFEESRHEHPRPCKCGNPSPFAEWWKQEDADA